MVRRNDHDLELSPAEVAERRAEFERRNRIARRFSKDQRSPTLGELRRAHYWLWVNCSNVRCLRRVALPLLPLIVRWGAAMSSDRLRSVLRCSRCGQLGVTTTAASWGGEGVGWVAICDAIDERWTGKLDWHPDIGGFSVETMCNLYSNTRSREAVRAWFGVSDNRAYGFEPMPAIFPRSVAPIVRIAEDGEREMVPASWGFPLLRKGYAPKPVTNVRDDKVLTSSFWRPSFEARRCLVPASSYCEPDSNSPAGWHWFALKGDDDRPLFAFPGIWRRYKGPMKKDGPDVEVDVYAFMTTSPNTLTATIMHDRMPVLLSDESEFQTWLTGSSEEAYRLVRTYPPEAMHVVQSGKEKRDLIGKVDISL